MKTTLLASTALAVLLLVSQTSYGHDGGHTPPPPAITENAAVETASAEIANLIAQGREIDGEKLNNGWEKAAAKLSQKGNGYYIVAMENPEENKTLYILMADYGKVWDANFSGNFEGIN